MYKSESAVFIFNSCIIHIIDANIYIFDKHITKPDPRITCAVYFNILQFELRGQISQSKNWVAHSQSHSAALYAQLLRTEIWQY